MKHDPEKLRREGQTWGEEQQNILGSFRFRLSQKKNWGYPEKILLSPKEAEALRDRLIGEISHDRFLNPKMTDIFVENGIYEEEIKAEGLILIR